MLFQQIRSATIKLIYDQTIFLIDPWLQDSSSSDEITQARKAGRFISTPLIPLPMSASKVINDVDYILVTHIHPDHFTPDYLPNDIPIIFQNKEDMNIAQAAGFTNTAFFSEDALQICDIMITRVNGRHGDNAMLAERMGQVSGFIFESENEKTIYIAGDTVFCSGVKENLDRFRPEIIVVNACDAHTSMGRLIMNKEDITELCMYRRDIMIIASHMDTVSHARLTRDELRNYLSGTPFQKQVYIPNDGETIQI